MGTAVFFHAHPDDESIATGGTMVRAKAMGHRVVLVLATRGEHGEPVPGVLEDGEQLTIRRTRETYESARILGVDRVEFLGYVDSGMVGTPTADEPFCFAQAVVDRAAARLALILGEEQAELLTVYDDNGGYGHPDHIQVHRVGHRAAQLVGLGHVFEHTINRTAILRQMQDFADHAPEGAEPPDFDDESFGKTEDVITHKVDVTDFIDTKRASMLAHRSQMADDHFLLAMPPEVFTKAMGTEWYIYDGPDLHPGTIAAGLFQPIR